MSVIEGFDFSWIHERLAVNGKPTQNPIDVNGDSWSFVGSRHPKVSDLIIGGRLSRTDIVAAFSGAREEDELLDLFVATMIWGYGTVGYGPWRVERMLASIEDVRFDFKAVQGLLSEGNIRQAYQCFVDRHIGYCGPAFYTKYLYFLSAIEATRARRNAYILDSRVAASLVRHARAREALAPFPIDDEGTVFPDADGYLSFVDLVEEIVVDCREHGHAGIGGDDIEFLLFSDQVKMDGQSR